MDPAHDTVGCVFWLAVYFFYFPYWTSPSYGTTYIISSSNVAAVSVSGPNIIYVHVMYETPAKYKQQTQKTSDKKQARTCINIATAQVSACRTSDSICFVS